MPRTNEEVQLANISDIINKVETLKYHVHNKSLCYPTLGDGVTITAADEAWILGNSVEIVPADIITTAFDIHFINVESTSGTGVFEIVLYKGVDTLMEIGRVRTSRASSGTAAPSKPICCEIQSANTRISAKVACGTALRTITISLDYHLEPIVT